MIPFNTKNYLELTIAFAITALFTIISRPLGFIALHVTALLCWLARDVSRYFIKNTLTYISPVDGVVQTIENSCSCPHRSGLWKKVSISTGLTDSHMQYSPMNGTTISQLIYEKGTITIYDVFGQWFSYILKRNFTIPVQFIFRSLLITIIEKEDRACIVETSCNHGMFNLIPGLSRTNNHEFTEQGDRLAVSHAGYYNMITNIYLPETVYISVQSGQTVVGSETIIACEANLENRIAAE